MFYTNYNSHKGQQLLAHPYAALTFYWTVLRKEVHVYGKVDRVTAKASDRYFYSRPRKSQLGAWTSRQSSVITSRNQLIGRFIRLSLKYLGRKVPRPAFWGGFALTPYTIQFIDQSKEPTSEVCYQKDKHGYWKKSSPRYYLGGGRSFKGFNRYSRPLSLISYMVASMIPSLPFGKPFWLKPVQIMRRQIADQSILILTKRHFGTDNFE